MAGATRDDGVFVTSAERSLELLLTPYLTTTTDQRKALSETDVRQISTGLRRMGKETWSRVPRVYTVLQMIDHVQVLDSFISEGISDIWFRFSHQTLPQSLRSSSARFNFLVLQELVLTKGLYLEREDGKHRHFSRSEDVPFQKLEELGKGGFGFVDRVVSTITYKEYPRKLIFRGKTFKKNAQVLRDFERELENLKKLSHVHVVELIGSYTDPRFVEILMCPVADYHLQDILERENLPAGERSFLRTFFGCLATALVYLHRNKIRHKDIKPQNVLVNGHQVFLTGFGLSLDWSELDQSTTEGLAARTPRYCAPEVASNLPRNSMTDLWSLGCVYLEIWAVLKKESIQGLFTYLECHGSKSACYHLNANAALEWCDSLTKSAPTSEGNIPLLWIRELLQTDQERRWTAEMLIGQIQDADDDPAHRFAFSGTCCIREDDNTDSDHLSTGSSLALETTSTPVQIYIPRHRAVQFAESPRTLDDDAFDALTIPSRPLHETYLLDGRNEDASEEKTTVHRSNLVSAQLDTSAADDVSAHDTRLGSASWPGLSRLAAPSVVPEPLSTLPEDVKLLSRIFDLTDPTWRPILDEFARVGLTEDQIRNNVEFIKQYVKQKQAEHPKMAEEMTAGIAAVSPQHSAERLPPLPAPLGLPQI